MYVDWPEREVSPAFQQVVRALAETILARWQQAGYLQSGIEGTHFIDMLQACVEGEAIKEAGSADTYCIFVEHDSSEQYSTLNLLIALRSSAFSSSLWRKLPTVHAVLYCDGIAAARWECR